MRPHAGDVLDARGYIGTAKASPHIRVLRYVTQHDNAGTCAREVVVVVVK